MSGDPGYGRMRWNTPLSEDHAALLLQRLAIGGPARVLDVGCGWGELLLRAVAAGGDEVTGVGVDSDADVLSRGRAAAAARGLEQRVTFVEAAAGGWSEPADRVLCIGSSHALGGSAQALHTLASLAAPGGRLLFGDGCWERPPTEAARAVFDDVLGLTELVEHAVAAGWRVLHLSTADQREWDDFESTWRAERQEWLLANPGAERAESMRATLDAQLTEYLTVYRGVLGFCYLVLGR